ncbi:MAG: cytochrome P450 [Pseudomonadota bacterium]|nr:cytochrome P450 [Pseudomonadota bacterium]
MITSSKIYDLSDNNSFAHGFPHEYFSWLRKNNPIFWHEPTNSTPDREGFWVVTRYDDIMKIVTTPDLFSSDRGGLRTAGGTAIKDESTAGKVLNQTDDPHHRRLRALVNKGFTVKAVNRLERDLYRIADDLINSLEKGASFDFVQKISQEIPTQAICLVLGVPELDRLQLCDWVNKGIETQSDSVIASEYANKVRKYGQKLIQEKRNTPTDDIFSSITHAKFEKGGSTLSDYELRSFFSLLFPAGVETTTRSISGGMLAFIENPDQWRIACNQPNFEKKAVEEIVRWTTPSCYKRRTATRDVTMGSKRIRAGDKVTFWEMSANRDDSHFDKPFRFDIKRNPNKHIGFGAGVHFCLGASLARLELRIIFEKLASRKVSLTLDGTPQWVPNNRLVGLKKLPVKIADIS